MSHAQQRQAAYVVAGLAALIGFVQLGNADLLGLSPRVLAWLGVIGSLLALVASWLPSLRNLSSDPDFLIRRIADLPADQQQHIATTMADRAEEAEQDDERRAEGRADPLPPSPRYPGHG